MQLIDTIYNTLKYEDVIKFFNAKFKYSSEYKNLLVSSDILFRYYFTEKHDENAPAHFNSLDLIEIINNYCNNPYFNIFTSYAYISVNVNEEYVDEFLQFSDFIFSKYNSEMEQIIIQQLNSIFSNLCLSINKIRMFKQPKNTEKLINFFIDRFFKINNYSLYNMNISQNNFVQNSNINTYILKTQIFENIFQLIKSFNFSYNLIDYLINNNYFETLCLNLSIGNLHELYQENKNKLDTFTCESINTIINNKYIELKQILKQNFQLSDSAIKQYVESI